MARPILFSAPMIRALRDGRKTQTRRLVKDVPSWDHYGRDIMDWGLSGIHQAEDDLVGTDRWALDVQTDVDDHSRRFIRCPYGATGDLLYVRETWKPHSTFAGMKPRDIPRSKVFYRADEAYAPSNTPWVPGIHQPRWASRLTLEITDVRVERLQDISEADADAECFGGGFPDVVLPEVFGPREGGWGHLSIPECYGRLWEQINGPGSWAANPWVWAVSFEVLHQNVDAVATRQEGSSPADDALGRRDRSVHAEPLNPSETNHG